MSELAERLLAALRAQGYGLTFTSEDMIVTRADLPRAFHVPRLALAADPLHELMLAMAIGGLVQRAGFVPDVLGTGGAADN